ncbi:MAG TPA: SpoIIE family protein phosphatase [Candidatus Acidoferrales bacterium]|nr:SpoIIE family protein phosphatase [Candidatus Acidoferrales bacterium]
MAVGIAPEVAAQIRILIADDQPHVGEALRLALRDEGYHIELAGSPAAVVTAVRERPFDLALLDLNYARDTTSGREGLELIEELRVLDRDLAIVVMTAWGSVEVAVEALQRGAGDFIQKPWDNAALRRILHTQIIRGQARRAERSRLRQDERDIDAARAVQEGMLPRELPALPGFQLAAAYRPARVLAGDYYDVLPLDTNRALVCIGDVAGKGMPAALVMSNLQAAVKAYAGEDCSPVELCRRVNRILCENCEPGRYVTFFCGVLDSTEGTFTYVNAGHNPPLVARPNGSVLRLADGGPVLGEFPDWSAAQGQIALEHGDRLAFYTDGITEATDADGQEFGETRLADMLSANRTSPAGELHAKLLAEAVRFANGTFTDDATLLVVAAV